MKNNLFLCVCALCITSLMYCGDSIQDLKKMIVASDLEAVEKLMPTLEVDQQTKESLVAMAHDVVIMRLNKMKTWELTRFKIVDLPAEVSKKIDEETKPFNIMMLIGFGVELWGASRAFDDKSFGPMMMAGGFVVAMLAALISENIRNDSIIKFAHERLNKLYENSIQIKQLVYTLKVVS